MARFRVWLIVARRERETAAGRQAVVALRALVVNVGRGMGNDVGDKGRVICARRFTWLR